MTLIKGLSADPWGRMDPKSLQTNKDRNARAPVRAGFLESYFSRVVRKCPKWEQNICVHEKGEVLFSIWLGMSAQTGILSELVKTSYSMFIVTIHLLPHNKIFKSWPFVKPKEEM